MIVSSSHRLSLALSGWRITLKGLIDNRQGEWWLLSQLIVVLAHFLLPWPSLNAYGYSWPLALKVTGTAFFVFGLFLAGAALFTLGPSLSPLPEPKDGAMLVRNGVYSRCRHPLYFALLLSSFGLVLVLGSLLHFLLLILLSLILRGKALREESKLRSLHHEYNAYLLSTPAIIPGIPYLDWRS